MKVMISQPMAGKTDKEIAATREKAIKFLEEKGYKVVDSYFKKEFAYKEQIYGNKMEHIPVYFLSKSLEKMSMCNAVFFCSGWQYYRGCKIEHEVALAYGLKCLYEEGV